MRDPLPVVRRGNAGDPGNVVPGSQLDAVAFLVVMAEKAKAPRTQRARASRSRDGQLTNYAGFGDQYFRLKSSLVREVRAMEKQGTRLVYPTWTPEDRDRYELYLEANRLLDA